MTRVSGFLVGALLMLGVFLLALGAGNSPTLVKEVVRSESVLPTESAVDSHSLAEDVVAVGHGDDSEVLAAADNPGLDERLPQDARDNGLGLDPRSWNQSMGAYETALRKDSTEESRYLVWSPFRSQWAAQGFARRLTAATDVPVEVRHEGPGSYQVVFRYRDDDERQAMVRQIETVTGLELE